jgi:hypothetical protein
MTPLANALQLFLRPQLANFHYELVFVHAKPFPPNLMFVVKARKGAYPRVVHSGSITPYLQTLDLSGNSFQWKTLQPITKIHKLQSIILKHWGHSDGMVVSLIKYNLISKFIKIIFNKWIG